MIKPNLAAQPTKARWVVFVVVAFLLSWAAYLPFDYTAHNSAEFYFFEADLVSDHSGITQLYYDTGKGFNEADSSLHPLTASSRAVHHWYALPPGVVRQIRFDFSDRGGHYSISHARITDFRGKVLHVFSPTDFTFGNDILSLAINGDSINATVDSRSHDPYLGSKLSAPLKLEYGWAEWMLVVDEHLIPVFVLLIVFGCLVSMLVPRFLAPLSALRGWSERSPVMSMASLAALSVAIQLHPVIFSGKSFVSPNVTYLLYDHFPSVPGYSDLTTESFKGSDVAALIYQHVPFATLEHRAIFTDHELPLWNRYDLGGVPLLGQGQSMFGEVLNMIPLLANGAAWSWDMKFVLARWVFAFALGLFIYKISRSRAAAATIALVAPWIGFFAFRANHPAQFSVCLSPLILLAWAQLSFAQTRRSLTGWAAFLVFAHWEMVTSGTVKEAYITMLILDLAGLAYLVSKEGLTRSARRQIVAACLAGVVFVLVSAPFWWVFLDTLAQSRTSYDVPLVRQIAGWKFIGIFEDMFYRRFNLFENHGNPSANVVVLLGVGWLIASLVRKSNRPAWTLVLVTLVPLSFAFGIIPASWLLHTPFLGNIYHVGNTFSCALIVLLIAVAGLGFADLGENWAGGNLRSRLGLTWGVIAVFYGIYLAHSWHQPRSSFFAGYIDSLALAVVALSIGLICRARLGGILVTVIFLAAGGVLLWRHGDYNHIQFDDYVLNLPIRSPLDAPSPAIEAIKANMHEPGRIAGLGQNLYCGTPQFYLEEGIYGIEALRSGAFDEFMAAVDLPKAFSWGGQNFGGERAASRGAMDLLNVRYYVDTVGRLTPVSGLSKGPTLDLQIYESPTVWPRAFFTNQLIEDPDLDSFAKRLREANGHPFADLQPTEAQSLRDENIFENAASTNAITSPARAYNLSTNTTSFVVDVAAPGLIVLTEAYYPKDFRVFLNDKPVEYLRVNYAFKGIPVSTPGTYEVRVEYWPHHLTSALILMGAALLMGLAIVVVPELRRGHQPEESVLAA